MLTHLFCKKHTTGLVGLGLLAFAVSVLCFSPKPIWAQANTATFEGTVTDPTGAVIPEAAVTLGNEDTQATLVKTTDASGNFVFTFVPPGVYTARIETPGFKTQITTGIELAAGQRARQTFALELGDLTENVTVEGAAPLVNTVSGEQLHSFETTQIKQLPLVNRNFTRMLDLTEGAVPSTGSQRGVNMNGVGTNGTQWVLDGTTASGNAGSNTAAAYQNSNLIDIMSVEGIQEVNAVKGVIPAEFAGAIGGQVNLISKSGTNEFHGSALWSHRNAELNARVQTLDEKPPLVFNQFGGSVGGPIKRDSAFFFFTYEGYREAAGQQVRGNVPTQELRAQMLDAVPAFGPALDVIPLPNSPTEPGELVGLFTSAGGREREDNHFDVRGDLQVTDTARLTGTFNHGDPSQTTPRIFTDDERTWDNSMNRVSVSYTVSQPGVISETRVGFTRMIQNRIDGFFNVKDPQNPEETFLGGRSYPRFSTGLGFSGPATESNLSGGPFWQISEKLAIPRGRHFIKFGGNFQRLTGLRNNPEGPNFFFPDLDSLLGNAPAEVTATVGNGNFSTRSFDFGFFFQDDFRVTPKLTLNFGLRYDFYSNWRATGKGGTPAAGLHNPRSLTMDGNFVPGPFRPVESPFNHDALNLGPRFGFAYNPDGEGRTAIRGGFGLLTTNNTPEIGWFANAIAPNVASRTNFGTAEIRQFGLQFPEFNSRFLNIAEEIASEAAGNPQNVFQIFNKDLRAPYTMQFTLDIQRQLAGGMVFTTGFVGTRGVKFIQFRPANRVDRITGDRPNPNLSQPVWTDNSQSLTYFGWQNSLKKRFSNSLSFDLSYTWSKSLATAGGDFGAWFVGENSNGLNQEFFDLRADRGPTSFDLQHVFTAGWVYQLPGLARFSNPARHVLGGWQVSGIFRGNTGLPATVTQSSSIPGQRGDFSGQGPVRFDNYEDTLQFLNPDAFQRIPVSEASGAPIRPGNVGRGAIRAPGQWNLDLGFAKYIPIPIREGVRMQIRGDLFNAFNHTNLSGLRTSVNDRFFGRLLSTRGARDIQVGLRIDF